MEALETFIVESTVPEEGAAYRSIISDIISELVLGGAIGRIKVVIRPEDSLFQMAIVLRGSQSPVKLSDFAEVGYGNLEKKEIKLTMNEEKYLPALLEKLWARYSRGNVIQPERKTLLIRQKEDPEKEISFLEEMLVADPKQTLLSRLVEMAIRSTPEGFRVRYHSMKDNYFIFVASEDNLKSEWIEEGHMILEQLQEEK
ncbi:methanogenesis marker 17 protein [Methanolobus halotolerans]|uniref:Methanogenesis marker 17 protein n=1 Tax=Methanolobus halotolerans TaxID=2052935 RepID=A0A4E0PUZ9_9EURY|nr:methanogenesis marker 17 protein [Methanolobus halotolerans]TGC08919.1 methanogenesis marker 17 protein [Methanolobus halotolerans]